MNTQKQPVAALKNELESVKQELKVALDARRLGDTEIKDLRKKLDESNNDANPKATASLRARIQSLSQQYAQFRLDVSGQIEKQNDVIRQLEAENNELRKGNSAGKTKFKYESARSHGNLSKRATGHTNDYGEQNKGIGGQYRGGH